MDVDGKPLTRESGQKSTKIGYWQLTTCSIKFLAVTFWYMCMIKTRAQALTRISCLVFWESEYLKQVTDLSDKVTESNAPMQNCGPKRLDFADAQTAPAPSHAKSNSSDGQTAPVPSHAKSNSSGAQTAPAPSHAKSKSSEAQTAPASSHAKSNSSEKKDKAGQTNSFNKGRETQPCTRLSSALSKASTRAELAALYMLIPPLSSISSLPTSLHAQVAYSHLPFIDPFSLVRRPCEAVVTAAEKILSEERRKGNHPSGVMIKGFGQFTEEGLRTLQRFCEIPETKHKIAAEARWLSGLNCTLRELTVLQSVLWNRPTTSSVLRFGPKSIDVISFCDLAEERYIDSFVIDVCIGKYIEESNAQGREDTLHLPTEFFQWMQVNEEAFKQEQLKARASRIVTFNSVQQILVPVFMVNHWGLVYVNLGSQLLYFDDGLTSQVPSATLPCVKEALSLLFELYPLHPFLQTEFWHSAQNFRRFGMPSQVPIDNKMIGVGSCGIGVIMAARDFIRNGPATVSNIKWRYCNMDKHRKDLMLQILRWGGHHT